MDHPRNGFDVLVNAQHQPARRCIAVAAQTLAPGALAVDRCMAGGEVLYRRAKAPARSAGDGWACWSNRPPRRFSSGAASPRQAPCCKALRAEIRHEPQPRERPPWLAHAAHRLLLLLCTSAATAGVCAAHRTDDGAGAASTTFQRSAAGGCWSSAGRSPGRQQWVDGERISPQLKRAVIASEDAGFVAHGGASMGVGLKNAWSRNQRAEARAERLQARKQDAGPTGRRRQAGRRLDINQQMAKNLSSGWSATCCASRRNAVDS